MDMLVGLVAIGLNSSTSGSCAASRIVVYHQQHLVRFPCRGPGGPGLRLGGYQHGLDPEHAAGEHARGDSRRARPRRPRARDAALGGDGPRGQRGVGLLAGPWC